MSKAKSIKVPDEFAAAMQQLSAEAAKKPATGVAMTEKGAAPDALDELRGMMERLEKIESALTEKIDKINGVDLLGRFQKIEEQLAAIRGSGNMNQRLFDSLHDELIKYRDNFLHESLQKPFIHDLVHLFDDLSSLSEQLRTASEEESGRGHVAQWRDNLENGIHSLVEVLHRLEVKEIDEREGRPLVSQSGQFRAGRFSRG